MIIFERDSRERRFPKRIHSWLSFPCSFSTNTLRIFKNLIFFWKNFKSFQRGMFVLGAFSSLYYYFTDSMVNARLSTGLMNIQISITLYVMNSSVRDGYLLRIWNPKRIIRCCLLSKGLIFVWHVHWYMMWNLSKYNTIQYTQWLDMTFQKRKKKWNTKESNEF